MQSLDSVNPICRGTSKYKNKEVCNQTESLPAIIHVEDRHAYGLLDF